MRFEILHVDKRYKEHKQLWPYFWLTMCVSEAVYVFLFLSLYLYLWKRVFNSNVITATSTYTNSVLVRANQVSLDGPWPLILNAYD